MNVFKPILRGLFSIIAAAALTLALFLVLPLMQAISEKEQETYEVQEINIALEQPPPDVAEEEEQPPPDPEDPPPPPEIEFEQPTTLSITQLDLLGGIGGISIPNPELAVNVGSTFGADASLNDVFDSGVLDQPARVLFQSQPKITAAMRKQLPATVELAFIVDAGGRVSEVTILRGSDQAFNESAIKAVKQWRFEPAQRAGKPVEARIKQTIEFPE